MESWTANNGCNVGCGRCYRGWVPHPPHYFPRRDPLIDAVNRVARTESCDRPARYPPNYNALPKFYGPQETPICCPEDFDEERIAEKCREEAECREKYQEWAMSTTPYVDVRVTADPCRPVQITNNCAPKKRYVLADVPYRTNILTAHFNPDDNKSYDEVLREKCDRFWIPCGPGLQPYPCRGVIDFPFQAIVDTTQPRYETNASICSGTKYSNPEYIEKQLKDCQEYEMNKKMEAIAANAATEAIWKQRLSPCYPPGCPTGRCCEEI